MTSIAEHLSPEQVKAARALLAWSQQDLASAARVAVSTVADFERGARTPVANNAQAVRQAFEAEGLEFLAGGVVNKAKLPPEPIPMRPGALVRWVNATHLAQWGETRQGQSGMPELLSRLIYATVGPAAQLRFPSDESVQLPGWDGVCTVATGLGPVPSGASVWEIGAQRSGVAGKADKDFAKRSADPLGHDPKTTTFVFVTPQRFVGKDAWLAAKRALGIWRDVVAIDGDDLVHWLETCPAVAQWLAVRIGRRPEGLRNLEEHWTEWSGATQPPLSGDLVLTNRDDEQTATLRWLNAAPELLSIQAESPDEAVAFLYAAMQPLPEAYSMTHLSRCVVADTADAARALIGLGARLIVVMTEPDPGLALRLKTDGHHVFIALGPESTAYGAERLPRPWRHDLEHSLIGVGLDEEASHRLAHASGRSITVLRRMMPAAAHRKVGWAERAPPELVAAMFAGGWIDSAPQDRQILSDLAGRSYEDVTAVLAPLTGLGGPLVRAADMWKVPSLRDLWTQIGPQVTSDQLRRFEAAFKAVMGRVNPRYERRPKSRYYEEAGEFGDEPSAALRRGLTEAMIALAVFPERAELVPRIGDRVDAAIRNLLGGASPALWWSLSRDFHNLAEAAPSAFLDALEAGLEGEAPTLAALFRSDEGAMHSVEYLSSLLWALEMLARSPEYLTRAALVLARLDDIDPGGQWGNRPGASLRRIFVTWSPQTYATPEQRLKVIDRVVRAYPKSGWTLLVKLAPRHHDTSEPSSKPNWRDFSTDRPEETSWMTVATAGRAIGERLLLHVGCDVSRWIDVLDLWANFPGDWRGQAEVRLTACVQAISDPAEIERLRDTLRQMLQRHRAFSSADWAMPEADLSRLDVIVEQLRPVGVTDRVRWLFQPNARMLSPKGDWRQQQDVLEAAQAKAAADLMAALSEQDLFAFAATVKDRLALGSAIARAGGDEAKTLRCLKAGLLSEDGAASDVGVGLLYGLAGLSTHGEAWLHDLWRSARDEGWGERAELRIVNVLPANPQTWAAIDERSESLSLAYWKQLNPYRVREEVVCEDYVDRLLAVGRARAAVDWLGGHLERDPSSALLIRVLKAAVASDEVREGNDATMFSYYVGLILTRLDADPEVEEKALVELEWSYFHALRHTERQTRTLHRALAREPEFFVQLLTMIYLPATRPQDEEKEVEGVDAERVAALASQAYDVLHHWVTVPGSDETGVIDGAALEAWITRARKLLNEADRAEIGDSKIGEILAAAKREPEQPWPPTAVREVIEIVRSRALESGLEVGVYNQRGVTVRMPYDGGEQERILAERYRSDAEALRFDWPRTAACLERIAASYDHDAARQDADAEQRDWM